MITPKLKPARPHLIRAALFGLLAIGGIVTASFGQFEAEPGDKIVTTADRALLFVGVGVLLVAGVAAVRSLSTAFKKATAPAGAEHRSISVALFIQAVGYFVVVISVLQVMNRPIGGLLLGGALTGIILGLAAQQVLSNFFAGLVLAIVRPFVIGDEVVLRSGPLGGEYEGLVADMNLFYVRLITARGPVDLPNAGVLSAAVGPGARSAEPTTEGPEPPE